MINVMTDTTAQPRAKPGPGARDLETGSPAAGGPVAEVRNTHERWVAAVTSGDPEGVLDLYAHDAVLLATFAPDPRDTPEKLREYFNNFTALPGLRARTEKSIVRVFDGVALHDGLYSFTYKKEGEDVVVPARFSFVYRKEGRNWVIAGHHSSQLPQTNS